MIRQELHRHRVAYSALIIGLFMFAVAIFGAWPNVLVERYLIGMLSGSYFIWGVVTHVTSTTLTKRVVFEYAAVATLSGLMLLSMT